MREKISFQEINKGKFTIIPPKDIAETNKRIKKEMAPIVKENNRKQIQSQLDAKKLIK